VVVTCKSEKEREGKRERERKRKREREREPGTGVDWGRRDPCNINISCMLTRRN